MNSTTSASETLVRELTPVTGSTTATGPWRRERLTRVMCQGGVMDAVARPPGLVPELDVTDLDHSIRFLAMLGFEVQYARPAEGFAYLAFAGVHLMLQTAVDEREHGNRQFVVANPDGYLWRPFQDLGNRPC